MTKGILCQAKNLLLYLILGHDSRFGLRGSGDRSREHRAGGIGKGLKQGAVARSSWLIEKAWRPGGLEAGKRKDADGHGEGMEAGKLWRWAAPLWVSSCEFIAPVKSALPRLSRKRGLTGASCSIEIWQGKSWLSWLGWIGWLLPT